MKNASRIRCRAQREAEVHAVQCSADLHVGKCMTIFKVGGIKTVPI